MSCTVSERIESPLRLCYDAIRFLKVKGLTSINLPTEAENCLADACADYRAVLCLIIHNLILSAFDIIA